MIRLISITLCLWLAATNLFAQTCSTAGQTPSSAFPVCGTSTFTQTTVPKCGGRLLPAPHCPGDGLSDINPFFYKFTCFESGTLGLLITPKNMGDDYDWELYDVTGKDPNAIYSDGSLVVASNWSGEPGKTGASNAGTQLLVCGGYGKPLFSRMPTVQKGHDYLLLVSHFDGDSQSGYTLSFGGGTAVITDSTEPRLKSADANCGGDVIRVKLNKKMRCNSLALNGSDFSITASGITIISARGINCNNGFDTDSIELQLSAPLAPGTYTVRAKNGTDGNTILDYCDQPIPTTDNVSVLVLPRVPTPMDSLVPLRCAPQTLSLIFRKPMLCTSVAPDGSDFSITGTYPVAITGARGSCSNGSPHSKEIIITLAQPLQQEGSFTLTLKRGSDGNTVLDECSAETPAGSTITFTVKDTVNAGFTYNILYGCEKDTISFAHPGGDGINSWQWNLDDGQASTAQNPQGIYTVFDEKNIELIVTNGFCSDTASQSVLLDNFIKADFSVFEDLCPNEAVQFTGTPQGNVIAHDWSFGDGASAHIQAPAHTYAQPQRETPFLVRYTVTNDIGCQSTATKQVKVYSSCYLAVPNAFTPNRDGKNDQLKVLNAIKAENLEFKVFNRWGQLLFSTKNWKQGWDGNLNSHQQPPGVYVWFLAYTDRDTRQKREMKGTVTLIR